MVQRMKVRIGIGLGGTASPDTLLSTVDDMTELGFDSLWLPEVLSRPGHDPLLALAWAGAHQPKLKLGTTMLLPGRNLVRLAKQLATLDVLTNGRFLVTFVPGLAQGPERHAVGVPVAERGEAIETGLPIVRRLLAGDEVDGVTISPLPVQKEFDMWLGGMARASLERCGRLSDGWLPSLCSPEEAAAGKKVIDEAAASVGREISPEHFGVSVGYGTEPLSNEAMAAMAARARGRDVSGIVPVGLPAFRDLLQRYIEVGFTKFVARPLTPPRSWRAELEGLAGAVGDLQT
jgi:probable F420-dependent oxidoreductase